MSGHLSVKGRGMDVASLSTIIRLNFVVHFITFLIRVGPGYLCLLLFLIRVGPDYLCLLLFSVFFVQYYDYIFWLSCLGLLVSLLLSNVRLFYFFYFECT